MAGITIDTYRCSGCGTCVEIAPEAFALDEYTGKAKVIDFDGPITDNIHQAASYCPEKCIDLTP